MREGQLPQDGSAGGCKPDPDFAFIARSGMTPDAALGLQAIDKFYGTVMFDE